jgi:hypothetical protein
LLNEDPPMPDDDDDQHIVLNFEPRRKAQPKPRQKTGGERQPAAQPDPEDVVASGAVILALVAGIAIGSGWLPVSRYTLGIVAGLAVVAVAAKLIKSRRSKASVTNLPRQKR